MTCSNTHRPCQKADIIAATPSSARRPADRAYRLATAVQGATTLTYGYDANGALLTRKIGTQTQSTYTYNADARLATSGSASASYKYNAFGQRAAQTVTGGGTHFLFSPDGLLLGEHSVTGTRVRDYIYLNGQPLAIVDAAGTVSYILNDQIGQPQKMLSPSGTVTWQRVSGIFGDTVTQLAGSTGANPQRFPGQQFDPYTALHYNYFRDYDPATGRYIEADPIGLQGGMNVYGYVDGNPVGRIDPMGLNPALAYEGAVFVGEVTGEALTLLCRRYPAKCMATIGGVAIWVANAMRPSVTHPDAAREHKEYKDAYASPMSLGLDPCRELGWKLKKEKELLAARTAWDAKWMPGRHAEAIRQSQNAVRNLERKMKEMGCPCP